MRNVNNHRQIYWQRLLTRVMYHITQCRWRWFTWTFIYIYCRLYAVKLTEAERTHITQYKSIQDFFTRKLNPRVRMPPKQKNILLSPADGTLFGLGQLNASQALQAKGKGFTLLDLLGGNQSLATRFIGGQYFGLYLSPGDYHRVHMPCAGHLQHSIDIPGSLHSVKLKNIKKLPELFASNERRVFVFDTKLGAVAVVMVGALIVRGIQAVWETAPLPVRQTISQNQHTNVAFNQSEELGLFNFGSTVIVLWDNKRLAFDESLAVSDSVKLYQPMTKSIT